MSQIDLSRDLIARGYSPTELARMTRAGQLHRVRRGAYALPPALDLDERAAHRLLLAGTVKQSSTDAVVSHMSAAVLHGLPVWRDQLAKVQLTADDAGHGKTRQWVQVHGIPLAAEDIVMIDGFAVTSLARTVLDLGCQLELWRAVAVGDVALRQGLDEAELADRLLRARRRYGIGKARRAAALLNPLSESPQESRSRVIFHLHGLPAPQAQFLVIDRSGVVIARTDFGWEELNTVGEFDGKVKYGRTLRPGQDIEEVLFDEKRREDAIRDLDLQVVRWVSSELARPAPVLERLHRAFDRGRRTR